MAAQDDPSQIKRRTSIRRLDWIRPHVPHSIASIARSNSTRSTALTDPSEPSPLSETHLEAGLFTSAFKRRHTLRKMPKNSSLQITLPGTVGAQLNRGGLASPQTPLTPRSPRSPGNHGEHLAVRAEYGDGYDAHVTSPVRALPSPPVPKSPKHKGSKIFSSAKFSRSTPKITRSDSPAAMPEGAGQQVYSLHQASKSGEDLPDNYSGQTSPQQESAPESNGRKDNGTAKDRDRKRDKHKFGQKILGRKGSLKDEEQSRSAPATEQEYFASQISLVQESTSRPRGNTVRSTAADQDHPRRLEKSRSQREQSTDRHQQSEEDEVSRRPNPKPPALGSNGLPTASKSSFLRNMKSTGSKAADGAKNRGKGFLNKLTRSGSSHERDGNTKMVQEPQELKVLRLPLVLQTRATRISKRLEESKDKTEFWMPSLPWRCIDYINLHGATSVGIYRVSGGVLDMKYWEQRFDKELDIDLLKVRNLHDVNTIASLFKKWLRELEDPIFPKEIQARICKAIESMDPTPTSTPQVLKEEISKLPPWNYYLLFAITCHISLLNTLCDENMMHFNNLEICFRPCMKMEPMIFKWLILDWKNCWLGCSTEKHYLEKEYAILDGRGHFGVEDGRAGPPTPGHTLSQPAGGTGDESRTISHNAPNSNSGATSAMRNRPLQHFDKPPPAAQYMQSSTRSNTQSIQQRPATAHANLSANGQRQGLQEATEEFEKQVRRQSRENSNQNPRRSQERLYQNARQSQDIKHLNDRRSSEDVRCQITRRSVENIRGVARRSSEYLGESDKEGMENFLTGRLPELNRLSDKDLKEGYKYPCSRSSSRHRSDSRNGSRPQSVHTDGSRPPSRHPDNPPISAEYHSQSRGSSQSRHRSQEMVPESSASSRHTPARPADENRRRSKRNSNEKGQGHSVRTLGHHAVQFPKQNPSNRYYSSGSG